MRNLKEALRVHWRRGLLVAAAVVVGYGLYIIYVIRFLAGEWPNYYRVPDYIQMVFLYLKEDMTPGEKFFWITRQSFFDFGVVKVTGLVSAQFVFSLSLYSLATLLPIALLLGVYSAQAASFLKVRSIALRTTGKAATYGVLSAITVAGFAGASMSIGGCCALSSTASFLSLMGVDFFTALRWGSYFSSIGLYGIGLLAAAIAFMAYKSGEGGRG